MPNLKSVLLSTPIRTSTKQNTGRTVNSSAAGNVVIQCIIFRENKNPLQTSADLQICTGCDFIITKTIHHSTFIPNPRNKSGVNVNREQVQNYFLDSLKCSDALERASVMRLARFCRLPFWNISLIFLLSLRLQLGYSELVPGIFTGLSISIQSSS